jgi:hypothetical protein
MNARQAALSCTAALVLAACSARGPTPRVVALLGGADSVRMLTAPAAGASLEAWRVAAEPGPRGAAPPAGPQLHGHAIVAGPVALDAASAAALADVLTSDATYLWEVAKACEFLPGVVVRWREGATTLDVLVCFSCDELEVVRDGARVGREDFDPRRADLVRVAKRLFPADAQLQALREAR